MAGKVPKMASARSFGEILRDLRKAVDLSQGDVRKALGYTTPQFISNWERGESLPPPETLGVLSKLYKVNQDELNELFIHFRLRELENELREKLTK